METLNGYKKGTFGYDLHFLSQWDKPIILSDPDGQIQVLISAKYQGKVFTSTVDGLNGKSLGYINYKVFETEENNEHIHAYGGESRLWLGPEGGQYSIFFKRGSAQVYDNWHTPSALDTEPWEIVEQTKSSVTLAKEMHLTNYNDVNFHLKLERKISLDMADSSQNNPQESKNGSARMVGYSTENKITNLNDFPWTTETGTVCIWILDMFNTSPNAVTIVPYQSEGENLGAVATTDYFGIIPSDRLKYTNAPHPFIALKTDGKYRSKIGLSSARTTGTAGNYNPDENHLVHISFNHNPQAVYLNQEWNPDRNPLVGDVFNAYNDGPLDDGSIMGPFLELESSSPAAFLAPMESLSHFHTVRHYHGQEADLAPVLESLFGLKPQEIKSIF
jgi:hypothetical protein